jgi:hypothetical protein
MKQRGTDQSSTRGMVAGEIPARATASCLMKHCASKQSSAPGHGDAGDLRTGHVAPVETARCRTIVTATYSRSLAASRSETSTLPAPGSPLSLVPGASLDVSAPPAPQSRAPGDAESLPASPLPRDSSPSRCRGGEFSRLLAQAPLRASSRGPARIAPAPGGAALDLVCGDSAKHRRAITGRAVGLHERTRMGRRKLASQPVSPQVLDGPGGQAAACGTGARSTGESPPRGSGRVTTTRVAHIFEREEGA